MNSYQKALTVIWRYWLTLELWKKHTWADLTSFNNFLEWRVEDWGPMDVSLLLKPLRGWTYSKWSEIQPLSQDSLTTLVESLENQEDTLCTTFSWEDMEIVLVKYIERLLKERKDTTESSSSSQSTTATHINSTSTQSTLAVTPTGRVDVRPSTKKSSKKALDLLFADEKCVVASNEMTGRTSCSISKQVK